MSWRPTQFADLHRIVLPDDPTDSDMRSIMPDTDETAELLKENAQTWEEAGLILAIVGVGPMWKGVGTVWTLLSSASRERGVALTRGIVRFIKMLHGERGYWRLQATVVHGDEPARIWILQLGFRYEGTLWSYGPDGKTHDMYARVVN